MKLSIKKTVLIYSFDPLNKINFHKYIDDHECLLVIVKMKNGALLAGFTEGPFVPKKVSDRDGLIMSLTKKKSYTLV